MRAKDNLRTAAEVLVDQNLGGGAQVVLGAHRRLPGI